MTKDEVVFFQDFQGLPLQHFAIGGGIDRLPWVKEPMNPPPRCCNTSPEDDHLWFGVFWVKVIGSPRSTNLLPSCAPWVSIIFQIIQIVVDRSHLYSASCGMGFHRQTAHPFVHLKYFLAHTTLLFLPTSVRKGTFARTLLGMSSLTCMILWIV